MELIESRSGREGRWTSFGIEVGLRGDRVTVGVQTWLLEIVRLSWY